MDKYDVICIGAGSGGLAVGLAANALGLAVLLIDKHENYFGGECLHDGCIPSKALLHQSKIAESFAQAKKLVQDIQSELYLEESPEYLRQLGLQVVIGEARFTSNDTVMVAGKSYTGRKIVIATGSQPRMLVIDNEANVPVVTNREIFSIDNPTHLLIIGGGPIGCELAQAFKQLGVTVTMLQRGERLLEKDVDFAGVLIDQKLRSLGIDIYYHAALEKIDAASHAHIRLNEDEEEKVLASPISHVLLAIGRVHDYQNLGLETTTVKFDNKGYPVINDYLQTSVNNIVLAGDATRQPLFSHMAEEHARVLLTNWLSPLNLKKPRLATLPWVTFTDPQVAKFGYSKSSLEQRKISFRVLRGTFNHDDRAYTDEYRDGQYEIYLAKKWWGGEYVAGGTVVAPDAGELVQELMVMAEQKLSLSVIRNKFYAYPTKSRFWQRVLLEDQQERLLTTKLKTNLQYWFRLLNR